LLSFGQHWKNGRPFFRNEIIAKTVVLHYDQKN